MKDIWVVECFDSYTGYSSVEFYEEYDNAVVSFYDSVRELAKGMEDYDIGESYVEDGAFGDPASKEYFASDTQYVQLYKADPYKKTDDKPDDSLLIDLDNNYYVFRDNRAYIRHPLSHDSLYAIKWDNNEFKIHNADDWKTPWAVPYNEQYVVCNDEEYKKKLIVAIRNLAADKLLD